MSAQRDPAQEVDPKAVALLKQDLVNRLIYSIGKDPIDTNDRDWFLALAHVVRDRMTLRWMETMRGYYLRDVKRVYYLSMEFLIGRTLRNSLLNMGFYEEFRQAVEEVGLDTESLRLMEEEAGLGNGGLGRLAACFLDSLATMHLPGFGYGIRYEYGMFSQSIENGWQIEHPDNWLRYGNPWEYPRAEVIYRVQFRGHVAGSRDGEGRLRQQWLDTEDVMAMAFDTPIPGHGGQTVNNLRLWSAKATREFDLKYFNEGNYIKAVEEKNQSENLSKVLYPDDTTEMGRELRLKQEYFFVSASLQDILQGFEADGHALDDLPNEVAIQLNDTHPSIAIPELMRLLLDRHRFGVGAGLGHHPTGLLLHQPHLAARGSGNLAGGPYGGAAAAPIAHHLRHQPAFFAGGRQPPPRRHGSDPPCVADRRGRRASCAHGVSGHRRQPQGQRCGQAAFRTDEDHHLP